MLVLVLNIYTPCFKKNDDTLILKKKAVKNEWILKIYGAHNANKTSCQTS